MSASSPTPTGVLLFNLGGPPDLASVEPFLVNLFSDRDIVELPFGPLLQPLFARLVAKARGPAVRRNYASIGGGSPQLRLTRLQAEALGARLNRDGRRFRIEVAMRYWPPRAEAALAELEAAGVRRLVTLTLYPQYSRATTGSSERELRRLLATPRWRDRFAVSEVSGYAEDPLYLEALADTVRRGLEPFPPEQRDGVVLLFSAHGLPRRLVERGDPYVRETRASVEGVLARLGRPNPVRLGYQSRTGPVRWISPGTDEVLEELGRAGVGDVLVIPVSFVSDHIETLYELDQLFAERARRAGLSGYRRAPALNDDPRFIECLARLVERRLQESP